jgi:endogenous inhibitor of DNA gyrase (YacG/DUF329 family)
MFSFSIDANCPGCGKVLESVLVDNEKYFISFEDGVIVENSDTDLILNNPQPIVTCPHCGKDLDVTPNEE